VGKDGVKVGDDQGDLVVEVLLACEFEVFLAAPCGPFRLCDCAVADEVRCGGFEGDAAVARDGPCWSEQFIGVDAVAGELDDVDVVTPASAGDAAFEDGDALLGDAGLGRVAQESDRVAENPVDSHVSGWRFAPVLAGVLDPRGIATSSATGIASVRS
jgi:hypothetical protein